MIHPHDTSTPALSAETVPSEELARALQPFSDAVFYDNGDVSVTPVCDRQAYLNAYFSLERYRFFSASHLAKEGGETVVVPYDDFHAAYGFVPRSKMSPDQCLKTRLRSLLRAEDLAHVDEAEAIAPLPQPSPALAKGGDAVREALRNQIAKQLENEADVTPDEEDASVVRRCARLVRVNFSYDDADAALATPSPQPVGNSEAEAVEQVIREWGEGPCDSLEDLISMVRGTLTAHSELAEIRAELLAGQGDDDGLQILPDFEEGETVLQMVCKCIALLETRRDAVEAVTVPVPSPQPGDAVREVNEEAEREAFGKWWPTHWPNAGSVSDIVWQGWLGRAALSTPTEGIGREAASFAAICRGYELMHRALCNLAGTSGAALPWYTAKATETSKRITALSDVRAGDNAAMPGDCFSQTVKVLAALTPPETAEAVPVAAEPAPSREAVEPVQISPDRKLLEWDIRPSILSLPEGPTGKGKEYHTFIGWEGAYRGQLALTDAEVDYFKSRLLRNDNPDPDAARLQEELGRIITDTESKDAADLEDMANVGHAIMSAIKRLGRSYSNSPEEILFDLENELFDAKREMDAVIATMDRTGVPREQDDVWFGLCRRIEMLSAERDDAVKALETAREALKPFSDYADPLRTAYPDDMPMTKGSAIAARQVTAGDFRRARAAYHAAARSASSQGGE